MFVVYAMLAYFFLAIAIAWFVLRRVRDTVPPHDRGHAPRNGGLAARALHRTTVRGIPVRFYRSPLIGPDFPWSPLRDLTGLANGRMPAVASHAWIYNNNPALARTVVTEHGAELLLCHSAGLELLAALNSEAGRTGLIAEFRIAMAEAYVLQCSNLTREQFLALCEAASRRAQPG